MDAAINISLPFLPEDLVFMNILTRLPAKSVGRFKCVSRRWRRRLSTRRFAQAHLKRLKKQETEGIILSIDPGPTHYCTLNLEKDNKSIVSKWFEHPDEVRNNTLGGTCNGLVLSHCVGDSREESSLYLWNPTTLQTRSIPCIDRCINYGLGYDEVRNDYHILAVSVLGAQHYYFHIYSLKENTWRSVCRHPCGILSIDGCFINGGWHYIAGTGILDNFELVSFHVERKEFAVVPYPKDLQTYKRFTWGSTPTVTKIGECLALFLWSKPLHDAFDIWLMTEYGVQESWKKYRIPVDMGNWCYQFVGVLGSNIIVLRRSDYTLVSFNLQNLQFNNGAQYDGEYGIRSIRTSQGCSGYIETLISPHTDIPDGDEDEDDEMIVID